MGYGHCHVVKAVHPNQVGAQCEEHMDGYVDGSCALEGDLGRLSAMEKNQVERVNDVDHYHSLVSVLSHPDISW